MVAEYLSRRALLRSAGVLSTAAITAHWMAESVDAATPQQSAPNRGGQGPMPYAPLSPKTTGIIFADLQAGIIERAATVEGTRLRKAITALAKLAHLFDLPVLVTTGPMQGGPVLIPEIGAVLGTLPLNTRKTTDAFTDAATRAAIAKLNRPTLLVAGVATEIIVQHTALSGLSAGHHVQVVVDACGGISERTEQAAFNRLGQAGVALTSVASVAGQLAGDLTTEKGAAALGILFEMAS